jgi:hypothetical protein
VVAAGGVEDVKGGVRMGEYAALKACERAAI